MVVEVTGEKLADGLFCNSKYSMGSRFIEDLKHL